MKKCTHQFPEEISFEDYVRHESLYNLALKIRDAIYEETDNFNGEHRFKIAGLREALRLLLDVEYKNKELTQ